MEVLLIVGTGIPYFPPQIPRRIYEGDYPYSRIGQIVSMIKSEGVKNKYPVLSFSKQILDNIPVGQIYSLSSSNDFFYTRIQNQITGKIKKKSVIYRICNIQTTRPWSIILDSQGGERIIFFKKNDKYTIIDKEINYAVPV